MSQEVSDYVPLLVFFPHLLHSLGELPSCLPPAEATWAQAMQRYTEEQYAEAAALFLEAGWTMLDIDATDDFAESLSTARLSCYHNAWECFQGANQTTQGRQALMQTISRDPLCAETLQEMLAPESSF